MHFLNWREWRSDFVAQVTYWLERAKPFHAELLRWVSVLTRTETLNLYHGVATLRGGIQKIGLPRPEFGVTRMYTGVATATGGKQIIGLSRPELAPQELHCGIATIQTQFITIGPAKGQLGGN